jgi:dTDP-4-amino-4,6-dideoxygalactose transaminase
MSATTIAILNVGAIPVYGDVDPHTWLLDMGKLPTPMPCVTSVPVSLYGLHFPYGGAIVDDAAQTLRKPRGTAFTSLSFQSSKVLSLGEGGALLTNSDELAARARSYLSLGYAMQPGQARIDSSVIRASTYERHRLYPCINGRMNDITAAHGLDWLYVEESCLCSRVTDALTTRELSAMKYRDAIRGCDWLTPQHIPEGWQHDMWSFAVACDTPERANALSDSIVLHGGERPYGCWALSYNEPALRHLNPPDVFCTDTGEMEVRAHSYPCPVAESLQPRLLQFATNNLASAERNAVALRRAIEELS